MKGECRMYGIEEVNGVIVGGEHVAWVLLYEGREQGHGYAESDSVAVEQAKSLMRKLKAIDPVNLYPNPAKEAWEVRMW